MKKKGEVKGETTKLSYKPGERLAESKPADEGIYDFNLSKMGKPFPKGWRKKPKKFPNRMTLWKALDTEDEVSGKEKELADFISLSPGALRRGAMRLAQAAQYPLELEIVKDTKATNHASVRRNAMAIDKMLTHIKNEEQTLRGEVSHEEYQGETRARIKWLPPEELDDSETDEDEDTSEEDDDGGAFGDDDEDEKPSKKGKKSSDDDEDDDDDDSGDDDDDADEDEDEEDEESEDEDEEADEEDDSGDSEDEDDDDDDEDSDSDADDAEEVSDEAVEELKKKPKPGKRVKQGPAKKGKASAPPKKKGKK